jgi:hypothetical protein
MAVEIFRGPDHIANRTHGVDMGNSRSKRIEKHA